MEQYITSKFSGQTTIESLNSRDIDKVHLKLKKRIKNASLNYQEARDKKVIVNSFPIEITIPTGDKCNLHCSFCTNRTSLNKSRYNDLNFSKYCNLISKIDFPLNYASSIALYGWGEPLVNPDYEAMYNEVIKRQYGAKLFISTNGILLTKKWAKKLVSYESSILNISLNASSPKTYKALTGSSKFKTIIDNLNNLLILKSAVGSYAPHISLSFVMVKENIFELSDFIALAAKMDIKNVIISNLMHLEQSHKNLEIDLDEEKIIQEFRNAQNIALKNQIQFIKFSSDHYLDNVHQDFCFGPWTTFKISISGDIYPCCYSRKPMGNILNQSFSDIWNGNWYQYYRSTVNSNNPPIHCKDCVRKRGNNIS